MIYRTLASSQKLVFPSFSELINIEVFVHLKSIYKIEYVMVHFTILAISILNNNTIHIFIWVKYTHIIKLKKKHKHTQLWSCPCG